MPLGCMIRIQTYQETVVCGVTMVIFLWIALGSIVVSTAIALLGWLFHQSARTPFTHPMPAGTAHRTTPSFRA
jgi:hypothetical protein